MFQSNKNYFPRQNFILKNKKNHITCSCILMGADVKKFQFLLSQICNDAVFDVVYSKMIQFEYLN